MSLPPEFISALKTAIGAPYVLTDAADLIAYNTEWRGMFPGHSPVVARPETTKEVSEIVKLCAARGVPIVPQGGNTGLVGGQVSDDPRSLLLSLSRMNNIRAIDAEGFSMIAEAGVTITQAQIAAEKAQRLFALSLASEGSCQIGGTVSTNAGGMNALLYGVMRQMVFGLEVVLADGTLWNGLRQLRKDNSGYDMKQVFIGAEGTLGIVTAAALKLFPLPGTIETAFIATATTQSALSLVNLLQDRFPQQLSRCELLPEQGLAMVLKNVENTRRPLSEQAPWYVIIELVAGLNNDLRTPLEACLTDAFERGFASDAALADSRQQRADFWVLREAMSEAQRGEGGSIKCDVSVPLAKIPDFLDSAAPLVEKLCPGARPVPFGHLGDGNIHYDICQPVGMDKNAYLARWDEISDALHALVIGLHGSIAAEHGVGALKPDKIAATKSAAELSMMRTLKTAFDPHNIMNPGKILRAR